MKKFLLLFCLFCIFFSNYTNLLSNDKGAKLNVAILIYNGVYLLDFCGPLEVFNDAQINENAGSFVVYIVAPTDEVIKAHTGTKITPDYSIKTAPTPDILVIPGGDLSLTKNDKVIAQWILDVNTKTQITMSVCTGAFILAELGLLDGMDATTWYGALDRLKTLYPKINIQKGKRFTDNGKIITTSGVSAGIDGALHVIERYFGRDAALNTAKYIEYEIK